MGKYDPLATFLRRQRSETISLSFREIERIVAGILPKASGHPSWWIGDAGDRPAPQKRAWSSVHYAPDVDFKGERVRFTRVGD
jgi:hypothetical protein